MNRMTEWANMLLGRHTRMPGIRGTVSAAKGVESLVCIPNERKTHLSLLFFWHGASLSAMDGGRVFLRDFVDGEV